MSRNIEINIKTQDESTQETQYEVLYPKNIAKNVLFNSDGSDNVTVYDKLNNITPNNSFELGDILLTSKNNIDTEKWALCDGSELSQDKIDNVDVFNLIKSLGYDTILSTKFEGRKCNAICQVKDGCFVSLTDSDDYFNLYFTNDGINLSKIGNNRYNSAYMRDFGVSIDYKEIGEYKIIKWGHWIYQLDSNYIYLKTLGELNNSKTAFVNLVTQDNNMWMYGIGYMSSDEIQMMYLRQIIKNGVLLNSPETIFYKAIINSYHQDKITPIFKVGNNWYCGMYDHDDVKNYMYEITPSNITSGYNWDNSPSYATAPLVYYYINNKFILPNGKYGTNALGGNGYTNTIFSDGNTYEITGIYENIEKNELYVTVTDNYFYIINKEDFSIKQKYNLGTSVNKTNYKLYFNNYGIFFDNKAYSANLILAGDIVKSVIGLTLPNLTADKSKYYIKVKN